MESEQNIILPPLPKNPFKEAEREQRFWVRNFPRLLKEYPEQFVAVQLRNRRRRVVAANKHLEGLLDNLEEKGLVPTQVWVKFMEVNPMGWILSDN